MTDVIIGIIGWYILTTLYYIIQCKYITPDELLNPTSIYKEYKVNIFYCILLAIITNLIFLPVAVCYWIYKLVCVLYTIGKK